MRYKRESQPDLQMVVGGLFDGPPCCFIGDSEPIPYQLLPDWYDEPDETTAKLDAIAWHCGEHGVFMTEGAVWAGIYPDSGKDWFILLGVDPHHWIDVSYDDSEGFRFVAADGFEEADVEVALKALSPFSAEELSRYR